MEPEAPLSDDPEVNRLIANITRMANQINMDFHPDPDKVRHFTVEWAKSKERARLANQQMKNRAAG